jgi:hypothetical protein
VDSSVTIADRFSHLPFTFHETTLGAWPSYYLAAAELLMRDPHADAFMLVQDDVVFYDRVNLRAHLEEILWPADPIGAVSLFCSKAYSQRSAGWHAFSGEWVWGALAFIFSRESIKRFLADPFVVDHRGSGPEGMFHIDITIGKWAHRQQLPIFYPTPSLAQHIGEQSSLWPRARAAGYRHADRFAGNRE